jgi:hypothetical protein
MKHITQSQQGAINDAMLALNYYISTGDHIGEGVAIPLPSGEIALLIAFAPHELEDADNWNRLEARLIEMHGEGLKLKIENEGQQGIFVMIRLILKELDLPAFTTALKSKPGPLGWGSLYTFLERHGLIK